jgi:hypothetical protein
MQWQEGLIWGVVGGFCSEILSLYRVRYSEEIPKYIKSIFYWVVTVFRILCGGLLVVAYIRSEVILNAILSINVGASAPLAIGALISNTPKISPGDTID